MHILLAAYTPCAWQRASACATMATAGALRLQTTQIPPRSPQSRNPKHERKELGDAGPGECGGKPRRPSLSLSNGVLRAPTPLNVLARTGSGGTPRTRRRSTQAKLLKAMEKLKVAQALRHATLAAKARKSAPGRSVSQQGAAPAKRRLPRTSSGGRHVLLHPHAISTLLDLSPTLCIA